MVKLRGLNVGIALIQNKAEDNIQMLLSFMRSYYHTINLCLKGNIMLKLMTTGHAS